MSIQGAPTAWISLVEHMLPQLIESVVEAWNDLERPFDDTREDPITFQLCRSLRACRTARELPFLVDTQFVELEPGAGEELGRLDIVFRPTGLPGPPDERVYFCLECKRLQAQVGGKRRSGASEYVAHGMMRFVSGQYASVVSSGGMLGYVLDGDIPASMKRIEGVMHRRQVDLRITTTARFAASSLLGGQNPVWETRHTRGNGNALCIQHILMAAN